METAMRLLPGRTVLVTTAFLALLAIAGCGGDEAQQGGQTTPGTTTEETTPTTSATGGPTSATSAPGAGNRITVTETEYSIQLPSTTLAPGAYTFAVDNAGGAPHDLVIKGPGVEEARTPVIEGGQQGEVSVTLQPGSYEVWCSVGNHRERGMETTLTVG